MENLPVLSGFSAIDLKKRFKNVVDLSSAKRYLRWPWLGATSNLQEDEEGTDVTFIVGDWQFRGSRCVLAAASPVFEAELLGGWASAQHVKINDVEPSIFGALLHYAATGALPDGVDGNAPLQHLLVAADRYGMHGLMAMCERRLCRSVDVQTVATTLALAEQHRLVKLKDACIRFVSTKGVLGAMKETDGFDHLVQTCPLVMVDILEHQLPSRVTKMLTVLGTKAAASLYRHARGNAVCQEVGAVMVFISACGLVVYISIKIEERQNRRCWLPRREALVQGLRGLQSSCSSMIVTQASLLPWREALLQGLRGLQSCASTIATQASSLSRFVPFGRLQQFEEAAWVNSDI